MRRWPVVLFLILFASASTQAEDKTREEANAILVKAADLETFKVGETPKFRVEIHFSLLRQEKGVAKGVYAREEDTPALWHEELEFGNFRYRKVRIKKQIWTHQNFDFVPITVRGLWGALSPARSQLADSMVVNRIKNRKLNDIEARCIEYQNTSGNEKEDGQICVQADTGYVIRRQYGDRVVTYSEFSPLGSRVRPLHLEIEFGTTEKIVADVNYQVVEKFDPVGFEPIVDGEVSDVCITSRPPVAKYAPDAVHPMGVRSSEYNGKVIVDIKVAPDGHVLNAAIAQSLQPDIDAALLSAIKTWQFEPGTCNGIAVTSVTAVTENYRFSRK